jgi:hypothetical protein
MAFSLGNIIMGLIGIAIGTAMVVKAYYLNHHVLYLEWAEIKWGGGGGTMFYRLAGVAICIFSIFVLVGWIDLAGAAFGGGGGLVENSQTEQNFRGVPAGTTRGRIAN